MSKSVILVGLALLITSSGCTSAGVDSAGQSGATATSISEGSPNTATPTDTPTPTETPAPTETLTPTPTPNPVEALLGSWSCESCPFHTRFEFADGDNGLQFIIVSPDGQQIEWMGPDRCENIYIPYYNCSVTIGAESTVTVSYIEHIAGESMPECGTLKEQEFQLQDGTLVRTRYDMTVPCAYDGPFYQDLLEERGPWSPYQRDG